eukprot:3724335-Lingulodinium_polyedra.AAC.1
MASCTAWPRSIACQALRSSAAGGASPCPAGGATGPPAGSPSGWSPLALLPPPSTLRFLPCVNFSKTALCSSHAAVASCLARV